MRTFSSSKPPQKGTRASILVHGLTGGGKSTKSIIGGRPLVLVTEAKAEAVVLKLNPNATVVVPESCNDLLKIFDLLAEPGFLDKGYTRIVLDSYTELANSLAGWIYRHSTNGESPEIGRRISIEEYGPIQQWGVALVKSIQLSGLPSIIIVRSESKLIGRVQQVVPAGLGNSPKNLPALLIPTVESHFDHELNQWVWDARPDDYSARCNLIWMPPVFTGTADEYLALVDNGCAVEEEQPQAEPEAPTVKIKRKRKEQQAPQPLPPPQVPPMPPEPPIASQEEAANEPDNDQTISKEQQSQIWDYLDNYKVDPAAFLQWAASRDVLVTDSPDAGIGDIRLEKFSYLQSLFQHDRSRGQFLQHLINLSRKTA